jgi:hypothetical protein
MAYTTDWDESSPLDHTKFKVQPSHVRSTKASLAERLKNFFYGFTAGETAEGCKKLTMIVQTTAPSTAADSVQLYAKDVDSVAEWFIKDESANEIQVTSKGKLNAGVFGNYANDTFIKSVDSTGTGTIDLIKGNASNLPELGAGVLVEGTADPATDYAVATKKYVDDQIALIEGVPAGTIVMWSGTTGDIPTGYVLCDGNNSTPDLRDRFVFGAGTGATHADEAHYSGGGLAMTGTGNNINQYTGSNSKQDGGGTCTEQNVNVMPHYYTLCFIMKS